MKRFVSILIALLLAVLPAFAQEEQFSPFDHAILHTVNGKYVVYEFPDITKEVFPYEASYHPFSAHRPVRLRHR